MKTTARGQAERIRHERHLHRKSGNLVVTEKGSKYQWIPQRKRSVIQFPRVFSFLEDPDGALEFFKKFRVELSKRFISNLKFDHSLCEILDLDAITLTDALLLEEIDRRKSELIVGGAYPKALRLKVMFRAIGTIRLLQHPEMRLPSSIEEQIERSDLYKGNGKRLRKATERDDAATSLVEYLDRVLRHQKYELSPAGRSHFAELITEVIGNAEEHSGRWYTRAFSQTALPDDQKGQPEECQVVIINFGKTIYESLSSPSASREVKKRIEELVRHHGKNRFFKPEWNEECLWTLCALQQGVSRYTSTQQGSTRGQGTIRMIEAFSQLAVKPQKMCIVSGSAYLLFDGTYPLYETTVNGETLSQISFNNESDLAIPPDPKCVRALKNHFPGTIISLRFSLNRQHLDEVVKDGKARN